MKRLFSILLVLFMLSSCLVACSSDDKGNDTNGGGTLSNGETVPYDPAIDSLYYDDLDMTIYYAEIGGAPRLEYEIIEYTGDIVNDVVFKRNLAVKEKF